MLKARNGLIDGYFGGSGEIRTHGPFRAAGFQDRCNRPLCHTSCGRNCNLVLSQIWTKVWGGQQINVDLTPITLFGRGLLEGYQGPKFSVCFGQSFRAVYGRIELFLISQ